VSAARPAHLFGWGFWGFVILMGLLTALFAVLGVWQVERLAWKENLIAEVNTRLTQPPYDLPPPAHWSSEELSAFSFHPVTGTGHFLPDKTSFSFTSLADAKGKYSGPGYWVITPFVLDGGGTVFVNRGFIPQEQRGAFADGQTVPQGQQTITGIAIDPQPAGPFTPPYDRANKVAFMRDPVALAALLDVAGPIFPMPVDAPAGAPGALPQGGETVIEFPNNHLGYAITWFGLALLTPCLLGYWIWRRLRPAKAATLPDGPA
jgi:surfeit locus 1 family protein